MKYFMVAATLLVLLSCEVRQDGQQPGAVQQSQNLTVSDSTFTDVPPGVPAQAEQKPPVKNKDAPAGADWSRKIIRTAEVTIEVTDYDAFNTAAHQVLQQYGAYVATEQQLQSDEQLSNRLTIKVPADRFDALLNHLTLDRKNKVLQKQVSAADVSAEYVDTRARLETRKQVRARYYELLRQANKMEDVLRVQSEIDAITEDIEAAAGRMNYLAQQSAYSTIHLHYFQEMVARPGNGPAGSFPAKFVAALKEGAGLVGNLVLVVAYVWPLAVLALLAWIVIRRRRLTGTKSGG